MPCCWATARARSGLREAMATGLNPAWRYATRWQSRMMKPAPRQPMRKSLRGGRRGRKLRARSRAACGMGASAAWVDDEFKAGQQLGGEVVAEGVFAADPAFAVTAALGQGGLVRVGAVVEDPVFLDARHLEIQ